jgi:hypothetical protein
MRAGLVHLNQQDTELGPSRHRHAERRRCGETATGRGSCGRENERSPGYLATGLVRAGFWHRRGWPDRLRLGSGRYLLEQELADPSEGQARLRCQPPRHHPAGRRAHADEETASAPATPSIGDGGRSSTRTLPRSTSTA